MGSRVKLFGCISITPVYALNRLDNPSLPRAASEINSHRASEGCISFVEQCISDCGRLNTPIPLDGWILSFLGSSQGHMLTNSIYP
jgi:hypothetical protein